MACTQNSLLSVDSCLQSLPQTSEHHVLLVAYSDHTSACVFTGNWHAVLAISLFQMSKTDQQFYTHYSDHD